MQLQGSLVRDIDRAPIGHVGEVLLDPETLTARWLAVVPDTAGTAGPAGSTTVLVPADAATEVAAGELLVPYAGALIAAATHPSGQPLTEADAGRLLTHYGFTV